MAGSQGTSQVLTGRDIGPGRLSGTVSCGRFVRCWQWHSSKVLARYIKTCIVRQVVGKS